MAAKLPRAGAEAFGRATARFEAMGPIRRRATIASAVWAVLVLAYAIGFLGASRTRGTVFLDGAFFLVTLALPLILIWLAAFLAEELARQRDMIAALADLVAPLIATLDATRASLERHGPASPTELRQAVEGAQLAGRSPATDQVERLLAGQGQIDAALHGLRAQVAAATAVAAPTHAIAPPASEPAHRPDPRTASADRRSNPPSRRAPATAPDARAAPAARVASDTAPEPAQAETAQADLPLLDGPEPEGRLGWEELMRAFDFPRDADDAEGFRALRRALRHRSLAQMLQAAEDVLTFLSQDDVHMDDLAVDAPDPEAWRRFVAGARGADVTAMGGVRDAAALAAARGSMKADPVFRDTALFFLRRFDTVLGQIAAGASDAELAELAQTRSGRAFQLMARVSGSFD